MENRLFLWKLTKPASRPAAPLPMLAPSLLAARSAVEGREMGAIPIYSAISFPTCFVLLTKAFHF
jgi:hypothetical protein